LYFLAFLCFQGACKLRPGRVGSLLQSYIDLIAFELDHLSAWHPGFPMAKETPVSKNAYLLASEIALPGAMSSAYILNLG
jgi:hypothetical protein